MTDEEKKILEEILLEITNQIDEINNKGLPEYWLADIHYKIFKLNPENK